MSSTAHPVLLVHGGAGEIRRDMDTDTRRAIRASLREALGRGYETLLSGQTAVDAAAAAVTVLEDAPHFNAGRGSVFTHDGRNEMDAAIMEGATRRAGAVAGIECIRNPVLLARAVMEHSPHVMLAGRGAEAFANECGIERAEPDYFRTEHRWQQLQEAQRREDAGTSEDDQAGGYYGTVGAVALDAHGHLAAATSTGGMTDKRWGRIGDSPVIGGGTYADAACAVSGTGWGEYYIRSAAAHAICMRVGSWGNRPSRPPQRSSTRTYPAWAATAAPSCSLPTGVSRCRSARRACTAAGSAPTARRTWRSSSRRSRTRADLARRV